VKSEDAAEARFPEEPKSPKLMFKEYCESGWWNLNKRSRWSKLGIYCKEQQSPELIACLEKTKRVIEETTRAEQITSGLELMCECVNQVGSSTQVNMAGPDRLNLQRRCGYTEGDELTKFIDNGAVTADGQNAFQPACWNLFVHHISNEIKRLSGNNVNRWNELFGFMPPSSNNWVEPPNTYLPL